ncbi:hypothetical protein A3D00_03660 [Candidatus Woesebacteria bacterium RIFCSPHIGHO2_02_FULL_38_9]|uniref:Peptidase M20 dimerisation domain-containing protein n=1 Tax=Candidatus Woesebacteria bacterium RIFCSPHIGHO2_01_FULL_39_28 TaxID=1802496 RepID=A0A1F7YH38_9BACT|nr:MAG: hypothetical protein A2627_00985 [Candidatus Woesebacteria bacterium RIFCSPHIGHO2_01_FULL_39_28]OGM32591.1 MAG: hypothetical protein A3D00_03660 [Candidatus Woesebacteria bacterium RIFCSPHIGHO2_02_FULL_38_9]
MNKNRLIKTFFDLVRLDSPSGEEEKVCSFIKERLASLNIISSVDKSGNLFAKTGGGLAEPVLLSAHMDTVEPGRCIKPFVKNEVIASRSRTILGADNKVAIAAILEAITTIPPDKRKTIELVFSVSEETDGGIKNFNFSQIESKFGIVADSAYPIGTIIVASPWIEDFEAEIIGRGSHASSPEKAINALTIAANSISSLKWGKIDKETVANIGIITGGYATNTIPSQVVVKGEVRSFSKNCFEKTRLLIESRFREKTEQLGGTLKFVHKFYCGGYKYRRNDSEIERIREIYKYLRIKPIYCVSYGGSDANIFISNNIRLVNIGDGVEYPHTTDEKISIENLVKLTEIIRNYISI